MYIHIPSSWSVELILYPERVRPTTQYIFVCQKSFRTQKSLRHLYKIENKQKQKQKMYEEIKYQEVIHILRDQKWVKVKKKLDNCKTVHDIPYQ
jgi:hypothetical protein